MLRHVLTTLLLAAPVRAQQIELTTSNNVVRYPANSCILAIDDNNYPNVCRKFTITKGDDFVGFWFENNPETHGYGFMLPLRQKPDRDGDIRVTHIVVLMGDDKYTYQGSGLCRIASSSQTTCTFTPNNLSARYSASASHQSIR